MSVPPEKIDMVEVRRIRRQRNLVLGLVLGAFVVLVYFISIVKIGT